MKKETTLWKNCGERKWIIWNKTKIMMHITHSIYIETYAYRIPHTRYTLRCHSNIVIILANVLFKIYILPNYQATCVWLRFEFFFLFLFSKSRIQFFRWIFLFSTNIISFIIWLLFQIHMYEANSTLFSSAALFTPPNHKEKIDI